MFHLSILTPEKAVFEEEVYALIAPGGDGYLEVLAHHAPLLTLIRPGKLTVTNKERQKVIYAVSTGFLEVSNNRANALIDAIEPVSEIDLERAKAAYERAQQRLAAQEGVDVVRAKKAYERAANRIRLYQEYNIKERLV